MMLARAGLLAAALAAHAQELTPVVSKPVSKKIELPGEIFPFLAVSVHAKVSGYVERVLVDRGSFVKPGDLLVELTAPELKAQIAESESKVQAAEADRLQAAAELEAARATADRLKEASKTPGAVAGNELVQAEKQVQAVEALVRSREQSARAAQSLVEAQKQMEAYLRITAPFEGVVTERAVHPGALVGPGSDAALLEIQQVSHLRLVVPVPEENVGEMARGASVGFHVPAFPQRKYSATVARIAHSLDQKTRTMAVELDVMNADGLLAPGMYPSIEWPVRRARPALWVPKSGVVSTTERVFVIKDQDGRAQWVDVKQGVTEGDLVEVIGNLKAGDRVVRRATDEIRDGAALQTGAK